MNYYNEFDPKAASWLRELIRAGAIPAGDVDTRSICDVRPEDLDGYTQCHFFSGIGGWSYALQLAGWPADRPVWTGSCPCQPFSSAGKQKAQADERHLWPQFFRLIKACRPAIVFGEQVAAATVIGSITNKTMQEVLDAQAVLRLLRQSAGLLPSQLQGVRECETPVTAQKELQGKSDSKAGSDSCESGTLQVEIVRDSIRHKRGEYTEQNRSRILRIDWDSVRPENLKGVELPIIGSDTSGSRLHTGQRTCGAVFGECDGAHMGTKQDSGSRRSDKEAANSEIERFIEEIGGEFETQASVWFDGISSDLEGEGYTCGASVISASSLGAPHIRQRLYWVANSTGSRYWNQRNKEGWFGKSFGGGITSGLADVQQPGLEGHAGNGDNGHEPGRHGADAAGSTAASGGAGGVGESMCERLDGKPILLQSGRQIQASAETAWSSYDLIPCRDGKVRRVESGTFPLAHGVPARVVRLRGYGNAIVPQVAAAFIQACEEVICAR